MAARSVNGSQTRTSPEQWRQRAQTAADRGDLHQARGIIERGCAEHPGSALLLNSAGHFAMRANDAEAALKWFAKAARTAPETLEYALNQAIALTRLGRNGDALALLRIHEEAGRAEARYCSARAAAEREAGDPGAAALWYEGCLQLSPQHARALHGRARVALERGETDAVARFERALAVNRAEPDLWLGLADALEVAGERERARQIAQELVRQAPHWPDALRQLAQFRLADGDLDFAGHFTDAARLRPGDPAIPLAHIDVLAGLDRAAEAADIAAEARRRFPEQERFALIEAIHAGSAGDDARAEAIFGTLALRSGERLLHEARHRIRLGQLDRAEALLDGAAQADPWSISVWALRGIVWRLLGDGRAEWLHGQPGLMRMLDMPDAEHVLGAAIPLLHRLHDRSAIPLGQSLRGGSQTRGNLFARTEAELSALKNALDKALEHYRRELPPSDPAHPLLRQREAPWAITGSWSVRLGGGGDFHTAHIHPQGLISSALYCAVSQQDDSETGREGWLELGRPPPDLRLDLPPLASFRPEPGRLALFPSTLYHGTRPFSAGQRMTVAFDVAAL